MTARGPEVFVVVTAPGGWSGSHGIDMLESRVFHDKAVGFTMDGWTVAARCGSQAEADFVRHAAHDQGLDSMIHIFYADVTYVD